MKEEEMKSAAEKKAEEVNKVADQLNQIKVPLSATMYSHGMIWTLRNISFWESLKNKDEEFIKLINIKQS